MAFEVGQTVRVPPGARFAGVSVVIERIDGDTLHCVMTVAGHKQALALSATAVSAAPDVAPAHFRGPNANMPHLAKRIAALGKELATSGFVADKKWQLRRVRSGVEQCFSFQMGERWLEGKYTVNVSFRYAFVPSEDDGTVAGVVRISQFTPGPRDVWWSIKDIEPGFTEVERLIIDVVIPWFNRFDTPTKILRATESGELDTATAFGGDSGWNLFHRAGNHAEIGEVAQAIACLEELIASHSTGGDWVARRREFAKRKLMELRG